MRQIRRAAFGLFFVVASSSFALFLSTGCGGDDESPCEKGCAAIDDCGDAPSNCVEKCEQDQKEAEAIGCGAELSALRPCAAMNACDPDACDEEIKAVTHCLFQACLDDPSICK